ncbi:MAG: alginate lyase family protein [Desulfomonilaceae bacterium]
MNASRWAYYARRLSTLRVAEPFYRIRSWLHHRSEKHRLRADPQSMSWNRLWGRRAEWLVTTSAEAPHAVNEALLKSLPTGWWHDRAFWDSFEALYPEEKCHLISRAERVLDGWFPLFQWKEVFRPEPIQWSDTMESEAASEVWPLGYYSDINVSHDPKRPGRDVKWCWELNRFQHLLWLGASWRLTGEDRFAIGAKKHLESWLDSVLYPYGVQWSSNLEVALRALSLARCHILCSNSPAWDARFLSRFIPCLYLHGVHLEKELTVHHTEGNHLLGECSALFCISTLYPLFLNSSKWRKRSVRILNRLVPHVILPDGVYAEQATGYFRFVAEFLLLVLFLTGEQGPQLSGVVRERLVSGLDFIRTLVPDCGDVPMIGDSDTGLAIGWRLSDFWDFRSLPAMASVLLGEPRLAADLACFPAEAYLMLGQGGLNAFNSLSDEASREAEAAPELPLLVFKHGGYQISREMQFGIIFDVGPLGIAPAYGHGHADGLSFILHYLGIPVVIDPGTCLYNGPPVWRNYFRSCEAHNTIRLDDRDPVEPLGTFRWSGPLKIEQEPPLTGGGWRLLRGTVNWGRIVHRRFLIHILGEGVIILDHVDGTGEHEVEWRLHFDPHWTLCREASGSFSAELDMRKLDIMFLNGHSGDVSILDGGTDPIGGWYSRYYGSKDPAPTIRGRLKVRLPSDLLTAFKPSGSKLDVPRDLPWKLLPLRTADLLRSNGFSTFGRLLT